MYGHKALCHCLQSVYSNWLECFRNGECVCSILLNDCCPLINWQRCTCLLFVTISLSLDQLCTAGIVALFSNCYCFVFPLFGCLPYIMRKFSPEWFVLKNTYWYVFANDKKTNVTDSAVGHSSIFQHNWLLGDFLGWFFHFYYRIVEASISKWHLKRVLLV